MHRNIFIKARRCLLVDDLLDSIHGLLQVDFVHFYRFVVWLNIYFLKILFLIKRFQPVSGFIVSHSATIIKIVDSRIEIDIKTN